MSKHVPSIMALKAVRRTANGKYQVSVICTDDKRTWAAGTVILANGELERCKWLPNGKCYHNDEGEYDIVMPPLE